MAMQRINLSGPLGVLEALYNEGNVGQPAVVICHPHPLHGGTMNNKVVYWIARTFSQRKCAVLRFNFRGVGASAGTWSGGRGEVEDTCAAIDWLVGRSPYSSLWLAGFSFGCYAGLRAARDDSRIDRMFAVAPAVNHFNFDFMAGDERPLVVVQGMADEIVPSHLVEQWVASLGHAQLFKLADAGHFFSQQLQQMSDCLARSFADS